MTSLLLESFKKTYANLELVPLLTDKELDELRIDYGEDAIAELEQLVEDSPDGTSKIMFVGHRGSGKSTLLAEFKRRMKDRYFVIFFSISDLIEMSDINHINILFAIAVQMMVEAEKTQVKIADATKRGVYEWFAKRTKTTSTQQGGEFGFGLDFLKIVSLKLKAESGTREEIKQEFQNKVSDLAGKINEIAALIQMSTKQEILVIIDDIDKIDLAQVEDIFTKHIKSLFQPNIRIIMTIPIATMREINLRQSITTEANDQIVQFPVIKLFNKGEKRLANPQFNQDKFNIFQNILEKRIPNELIEPEAMEAAIIASGGALRQLIQIGNECCRICLRMVRRYPDRTDIKINAEVMQEALNKIKLDLAMSLGTEDYKMLAETYINFTPPDAASPRFLKLLHGLYVLEYRNSDLWYDVHPLVIELLQTRGLV